MVYLTTFSVAKALERQTMGSLVTTELEGIWK
jgi:hypothetical protein